MQAAPRRILIVRLSAIGDVARALPALEALRRAEPEAHIAWLVEDRAAATVQGHPALDAVYVFERKQLSTLLRRPWRWRELARRLLTLLTDLRRRPYDLVIDFQSLLKSGILTWATGAPVRVGFVRERCREPLNVLFTNATVDPGDPRLPRIERNLRTLAHFVPCEHWHPHATWHDPPEAAAWADRVVDSLDGPAPIVLHPGTSRAEKWWWPSCWAAVADALREQTGGPVLLTWGPGEREAAEAVREAMWGPAQVVEETTTLHHLVALIRRAACFVTTDNGPMHLAAMVDTPVVGLFGPVDVRVNQPLCARMRCVTAAGSFGPEADLPADGGSMRDIRASDVIAAALDLLPQSTAED